MSQLTQFSLEDGTTFLVEVEDPESESIERVSVLPGQTVVKAQQTFEKALDTIKPVAATIISKLKEIKTPADEVQVKFGIKLTADAGAVFTSIGGEVNYEITLKWSNKSN